MEDTKPDDPKPETQADDRGPGPACCCSAPLDSVAERRNFLAAAASAAFAVIALIVPTLIGVFAAVSPLRLRGRKGEFMRLASLASLPEDGTPRRVPVVVDRSTDAWNVYRNQAIGSVLLRRTGEKDRPVEALNATCPHAGCTVQYAAGESGGKFFCPCHAASFDLTGKRLDATSPSPRDLDTLEVKLEGEDVLVKFENYQVGTSKKVVKT